MKAILPLISTFGVLLLANCASTNTPSARIEKDQQAYHDLSEREQELASKGEIEAGMSSQAVYFALGEPSRKLEGESNGTRTMRWDYSTLSPIYSNSFHGGFSYGRGFGRGRFGRGGFGRGHGRRGFSSFGYSPSVHFVPTRSGSVWFENNYVKSWERVTR